MNNTLQQPKERPILFSGQMVRAILGGRKTQTRRVIKNIPHDAAHIWHDGGEWIVENAPGQCWNKKTACPYGQPGDRLWVRETWQLDESETGYVYRADIEGFLDQAFGPPTWRPSIFMPRAASRILLEIVSVRAERLQDISEEDAKSEGVRPFMGSPLPYKAAFCTLWQHINGPESWAANPWVWVVEFKKI